MSYFYNSNIDSLNLDTGDIIIFNGCNNILSYAIECLTWSKYSHCGIVLKNPRSIGINADDGLYMIESGYDSCVDIETGRKKFGVEIVNLKECVNKYTGYVYVIKLDFVRNQNFYDRLERAYRPIKQDIYDINPYDLLRTILNIDVGNNNRTNMFICSALVSYLLYSCNLIFYLKWDLVEPKHLASLTNKNHMVDNAILYRDYNPIDKEKNIKIIFKSNVKITPLQRIYP